MAEKSHDGGYEGQGGCSDSVRIEGSILSFLIIFGRCGSDRASTMNLALPSNAAFAYLRATVFSFFFEIDPISEVYKFFLFFSYCADLDLLRLIVNNHTTCQEKRVIILNPCSSVLSLHLGFNTQKFTKCLGRSNVCACADMT